MKSTIEWIPLTERLPRNDSWVLISTPTVVTIALWKDRWYNLNREAIDWLVTCWAEIPSPPSISPPPAGVRYNVLGGIIHTKDCLILDLKEGTIILDKPIIFGESTEVKGKTFEPHAQIVREQ